MKRRGAIVAAAFAVAVAAGTAIGPTLSGAQQQAAVSGAASSDPLDLFSEMVPVFTHPRCANCHGGVDPHAESGPLEDTHDGGIIPENGTCADSGCHTQTDDSQIETRWRTASPFHSFGGKSAKELCDMQSPIAKRMRAPEDYFHHLSTDFLIDLAFVGQSGGANSSTEQPGGGNPPRLTHAPRPSGTGP